MHNIRRGTIGELVCALRLMKLGVDCQIINFKSVDIIADTRIGPMRVQVKSSMQHQVSVGKRVYKDDGYYHFCVSVGGKKDPLTPDMCDIVALVATDVERVKFVTLEQVARRKSIRTAARLFTVPGLEEDSWESVMEDLVR